jgi:hypothetical protein
MWHLATPKAKVDTFVKDAYLIQQALLDMRQGLLV